MGWPGSEAMMRCKKHPKHKQSPGVCSMCLREKLSHLSSTKTSGSSITYVFNSSSVSSSISSAMSSSCSSPSFRHDHVKHGPVSILVSGKNGLQRSRSMAFVEARKRVDYGGGHGDIVKEKKRGFWSRLLGSTTSKKNYDYHRYGDPLMRYSRTMKEARVTGLMV